jgi:hypothetical protein
MRKLLMLTCGAALSWSAAASAEVLISPPLVAEGPRFLDCYLVNVSPYTRKVKIEVLTAKGKVVRTVNVQLDPGEEDVARADSALLGRYCRFTVPSRKSDYRASVLVRQSGVGAISALPAS